MSQTKDRNGLLVQTGTVVRVLQVRPSVLGPLSQEEALRVKSLVGEALSVYEVDEWGSAWVEKWWSEGNGKSASHSLALSPDEMEVVSNDA
jgi:hypothetical protein